MKHPAARTVVLVSLFAVTGALALSQANQMVFNKVEIRTSFGRAEQGDDGKLVMDSGAIRFTRNNERDEYLTIPTQAVTEVFYSRVSGRRIKTAVVVSPLLLFSKGKKHYMTLSFNDGRDLVGAIEFKLDKSNYRGVLRAVEELAGVEMKFDQEGIKDEKETVAGRTSDAEIAVLKIETNPAGAEIEIDGAFAGTTPRTKRIQPGEYEIKIRKKGFKDWERKIRVEAGEEVPISVELESN